MSQAPWTHVHEPLIDNEPGMTTEAICAAALASAPRNALLRHPHLRKLYLAVFVILALVVLVPSWSIWYAFPMNRPRRAWTVQRCLRVRWSRLLCALVARCEIDHLGRDLSVDLDPVTLKHSHPVNIAPAPDAYLRGHVADMLHALHRSRGEWIPRMVHRRDPAALGVWGRWNGHPEKMYGFEVVKAFWFTGEKSAPEEAPRPREPGDAVGLHFHGGGYLCGTAAETDLTSSIPKTLVGHSPIHHILSVDYRLAPTSPWPLPLLDAISAYHHLVHVEGVDEGDIVVFGDSAGGHLALALARYLRDEGPFLGLCGPRALVLMSPWVDVGFTNAWGDGKWHNATSDTIDDTFGPFATSLLLRAVPLDTMHTSAYLSPAGLLLPPRQVRGVLDAFPPIFVVFGGAERLSSSISIFWHRLSSAEGRDASADVLVGGPDCVHDFLIFPWQEEEAAVVYRQLDEWLRDLLSSDADTVPPPVHSPTISPASPFVTSPVALTALASPLLSPVLSPRPWTQDALARRRSSRRSLKTDRSPVIRPSRPGMGRMVGDMRHEAMSYIDLPPPPLDLDGGRGVKGGEEGGGWLSPFTAQQEKGEWDWELGPGGAEEDEGAREWYDPGSDSGAESVDETRKDR